MPNWRCCSTAKSVLNRRQNRVNTKNVCPLQVIALGKFSQNLPPLALRLKDIEVAPRRCAGIDALDASLAAHQVLLTDLYWLNELTPEKRSALATRAEGAACWIVLTDEDTRFKEQVDWQRLGITQFFQKPLDPERLANLVEDLHDRLNGPLLRAILIDDDMSQLSYYSEVLRHGGIECLATSDPLQAFDAIIKHRPDVLIFDIEMPVCRGPELISIIRQHPEYERLPVIFMTAMQGSRDKLQARETAAEYHLIKPVEANLLLAAVEAQARRFRSIERREANAKRTVFKQQAFLERLRMAMDQHDIVTIADAAGNITYANEKFCAISGYRQDELLGRNHRIVKSDVHTSAFYRDLWATIRGGHVWHGEVCNRTKQGTLYWVDATIVPFLDEQGCPYQYIGIRTDITESRVHGERLRASEKRLSLAIDGAGDGIWDWDIATGNMLFSGNYEGMLGFAKSEILATLDAWVASVHPDDLPGVQGPLQDYIAGRLVRYEPELRLRCKDGSYKWVLCRGVVVARDEAGQPTRIIGIHSDISARKQAERQVTYLKEAIETISEGFAIYDAEDRFVLANAKYRELYDLSSESLVPGRPFADILRDGLCQGKYSEATGREDTWLEERLHKHRSPGQPFEQQLADGRWLRVSEYRMADGSLAGLRADITDLKLTENSLIEAKESAERANQAKSDFLSSMSHELRTPMNVILGFAQVLEQDDRLDAEQLDNLHEISKAGHHLLELINEVLDLAKIESGRINLSMEGLALASLFDECRSMIAPLAASQGLHLDVQPPADLAVFADRGRLKQVLLNLLSNAVKYNRPGGTIVLTAERMPDARIRLAVRDGGKGIAPDRMAELFQPFNRLDAEASQIEGTGIGLSISKRLIEMMGGDIGVESEVGVGSTFWLVLNASNAVKVGAGGTAAADGQTAECEPAERADILCIDDNPANLKLFSQILGKQPGLHLRTAHVPEQGIEMALTCRPDLILLDINMPGLSGYDVLEILHSDPKLRSVPIVAVTANAMPADIERGKAAGFADYVTKPIMVEPFLASVRQHLAFSRQTNTAPAP